MSVIEATEWETCLLATDRNPKFERFLRKELGGAPPGLQSFADCPWLVRILSEFNFRNATLVHTSFDLADLVVLVVSQDNSCRYCFAEQRLLLRATGMREERIRRIEQDLSTAELDARDRLALDFARRLSQANPLPGAADWKPLLDAGFGVDAIKELGVAAAATVAANRLVTLPALPPQALERHPDRWRAKLLAPLTRRTLASLRKRGRPEPLPADLKSGPFSYLVLALEGLPFARALRRVVDEAWRSPILTRRAKALVVAVVARGLGATASEAEAARLLAEEGVDATDFAEILAHLASPRLDPVESLCVPFARETIRYRPAQIQRRARELREKLSVPQFLEVVGIAALANMLGRLDSIAGAR